MSERRLHRSGNRPSDGAHDQLAAFLALDIQRSPDWAKEILAKIADVQGGALPSWERVGNAYRLHLSAEGALIEDLVDRTSPVHRIPLAELEAAVTAWLEALG